MVRLCVVAALLPATICLAQVTGSFAIEKGTFAPGEPVVLSFTLHNAGKTEEEVHTADPYVFCSDYNISITREEDHDSEPVCRQGWGGSCMSGAISLAPGAFHTERILLNYRNTSRGDLRPPVKLPGDYTIEATRDIAFAVPGPGSPVFNSPDHREVRQTFHLRVDENLTVSPSVYAPFIAQLKSPDFNDHMEAARTLATLAPPTLEPLLLTFATSKDPAVRQMAPLALANLHTKASLSALAGMLLTTEPGTYESSMAAQYLGETQDPAWFPVLLEFADQHGTMQLSSAAQSGGESAIPALLTRIRSSNPDDRNAAINALGYTGSRAAVPILINLLPLSPSESAATNTAVWVDLALTQLTHVSAERGSDGAPPANWRARWQQWWLANGSSTTIYKPGGCPGEKQLP